MATSYPYAPRLGCPLCTIVALSRPSSAPSTPFTPSFPSFPSNASSSSVPSTFAAAGSSTAAGTSTAPQPLWVTPSGGEVIYQDEDVTAYIERSHPVSSRGHMVVVFNSHIPSLYSLTTASIPLLRRLVTLCPKLLAEHFPSSPPSAPAPSATTPTSTPPSEQPQSPNLEPHIGFLTPPLTDPHLPIRDHLHLHAYLGPADLLPWLGLRALAFSSLGWYDLEDLIAEIRESTSNNRVKTGYGRERRRPIEGVPEAGVGSGWRDGVDGVDGVRQPGGE